MPRRDEDADSAIEDHHLAWCGCTGCTGCGGCGVRADAWWRAALAELAGTALLVLLSCLPAAAEPAPSTTHAALAAGLVVTALVQSLDHISGAFFNPSVLLAAVVWGRVRAGRAAALLAAQLAGATVGAGVVATLRSQSGAQDCLHACVTRVAPHIELYQAVLIEAVLGGILALVNCGAWDARTVGRADSWPLRIGLTVAGMSLAAGSLTGASMNPARSFGPALWAADWTDHWVYWVAPPGGALLATLAYTSAWRAMDKHGHKHKALPAQA